MRQHRKPKRAGHTAQDAKAQPGGRGVHAQAQQRRPTNSSMSLGTEDPEIEDQDAQQAAEDPSPNAIVPFGLMRHLRQQVEEYDTEEEPCGNAHEQMQDAIRVPSEERQDPTDHRSQEEAEDEFGLRHSALVDVDRSRLKIP